MSPSTATPVREAKIRIHHRLLEELLEALARAPFAVSPELEHDQDHEISLVRFLIAPEELDALRDVLLAEGFGLSGLEVRELSGEFGAGESSRHGAYDRHL